jgi:carboxyl-terminal processing protease
MKTPLILLFLLFSTVTINAQPRASEPAAANAASQEARRKSFEKVWETVNDKHYDPTFGGVDWKRVKAVYEPKAMAAGSDREFHDVLRQMLAELKLSHFGIHPPAADIASAQAGRGVTGIDILMLEGVPVINRVEKGSAAEKAGVRPGQILSSIDGKGWPQVTAQLEASLAARKTTESMRKVYLERTIEAAMNGKPETTLVLEALDGEQRKLRFEIVRSPFTGEMSQALGNFPAQEVVFESKLIRPDVGYIRFNMWVIPQMAKLRKAMAELANSRAIIIDLRGNPGGVGGMAPGLAGLMFDKKTSLGSMRMRSGSMEFVAFPQPNNYTGQIIILTDHGTGSTSEVFAAGMQETGRATVVGDVSAGAVLPSVFEKLATGYLFQYAISDYRSPNNILIEGRGVIPNVSVRQTREALLAGRDLQLEEALKLVNAAAAVAGRW